MQTEETKNAVTIEGNDYKKWLANIKTKIRQSQIKAAINANTEQLNFYWSLGADIVEKQSVAKWGDKLLNQLSKDLTAEFPNMKGFSLRNIKYIKQWYLFYTKTVPIGQQAVAQLKTPIDHLNQNRHISPLIGDIFKCCVYG